MCKLTLRDWRCWQLLVTMLFQFVFNFTLDCLWPGRQELQTIDEFFYFFRSTV
jgi:hypothetical protein